MAKWNGYSYEVKAFGKAKQAAHNSAIRAKNAALLAAKNDDRWVEAARLTWEAAELVRTPGAAQEQGLLEAIDRWGQDIWESANAARADSETLREISDYLAGV
jgi:hypothetical protein